MASPIFVQQTGLNANTDLPSAPAYQQWNTDVVDAVAFLTSKAIQFEKAPKAREGLNLVLRGRFGRRFTGKRIPQ